MAVTCSPSTEPYPPFQPTNGQAIQPGASNISLNNSSTEHCPVQPTIDPAPKPKSGKICHISSAAEPCPVLQPTVAGIITPVKVLKSYLYKDTQWSSYRPPTPDGKR